MEEGGPGRFAHIGYPGGFRMIPDDIRIAGRLPNRVQGSSGQRHDGLAPHPSHGEYVPGHDLARLEGLNEGLHIDADGAIGEPMVFDPRLEVLRRTQHDIVTACLERLAQRDEGLSIPAGAKRKKGDLHGPFSGGKPGAMVAWGSVMHSASGPAESST